MLTLGVGAFENVDLVLPDGSVAEGTATSADPSGDLAERAGHGWVTLQIGAHFDLLGTR